MKSNEALLKLGAFKKWQVCNYLMLCLSVMIIPAWHTIAIVYIAFKPEHHCTVPTHLSLNQSIPLENGKFSSCLMYKNYSLNSEVVPCNNGWTYLGGHGETIVTKWDLVCDRSHLAQTPQTAFIIGSIFGSIFFSALSDKVGRKPVFLFCHWITVVFGVISAFVNDFNVFCVLRFFVGAFAHSILNVGFILTCELFAAPHRTFVGTIIENFWALALAMIPLMAFLLRDWVYLEVVISLAGLLTIPLYWLLPESVLWLEIKGRTQEAEKILQRGARINKIILPNPIFKHSEKARIEDEKSKPKTFNFSNLVHWSKGLFKKSKKEEESDNKNQMIKSKELFCNRTIRKHLFLVSLLWLSVVMVYFAFLFTTAQLAGSHYLNGFISAVIEIPAYLASYFVMLRVGRKISLMGFQAIGGVALILQVVASKVDFGGSIDGSVWVVVFNMVGRCGISGAYGSLDLFAPELFPTTLRNLAQGIASVFGRLGTIVSTFLPFILEKNDWVPLVVLAMMVIVGCMLVFLLPETIHRNLPHTILEIEQWYVKKVDGGDGGDGGGDGGDGVNGGGDGDGVNGGAGGGESSDSGVDGKENTAYDMDDDDVDDGQFKEKPEDLTENESIKRKEDLVLTHL